MSRIARDILGAVVGLLVWAPGAEAAITFADAVPYAVANGPNKVALADLNKDAKLDIVVTTVGEGPTQSNGTVSVLLGKGDGTFHPAVPFIACNSANGTAVGDFNGDGKLDVVASCTGGQLATLTGKGDGTLNTPADIDGAFANGFPAAVQIDGVGKSELVYQGTGPFGGPYPLCLNSYVSGNWSSDPAVCRDTNQPLPDQRTPSAGSNEPADVSGDSGQEVLTGGDPDGARVLRRASSTAWTQSTRDTGDVGTFKVIPTDLQGDGDIDVVTAGVGPAPPGGGPQPGRVAVLLSDGTNADLFGGIPVSRVAAPYPSYYPEDGVAGDFDGDGLNDIAVVAAGDENGDDPSSGDGLAFHGNPDGTLRAGENFKHPSNGADVHAAAGDLNGDGKDDAVICAYDVTSYCSVLRATGSAPPANPGPAKPRPPGGGSQTPRLELTEITSGPSGTIAEPPTFAFRSPLIPNATFECRFDDFAFRPCTSPHTGWNLGRGPHTFEVRAVDSGGTPDPTPASRSFTIGTVTRTGSCTIQVPWNGSAPPCTPLTGICSVGSHCTLTGTVDVTSEDLFATSDGSLRLEFEGESSATASCSSTNYRPPPPAAIFGKDCPQRASVRSYGAGEVINTRCSATEGAFDSYKAKRGPDDARTATCTVTLKVEPAKSLALEPLNGTSTSLFAPGAGKLTVTGTSASGTGAAGRRKPRKRQAIRPIRRTTKGPGRVKLKLKPTARVKKALRRKRRVKLRMRITFVPTGGRRTVRTQKITLKPKPRKRRRP